MHNKRGFTLIELIVTMSILSIVIMAAGTAIYSAAQSYSFTVKMLDDEYNARFALLSITREIHRGMIYADFNSNKLTLQNDDFRAEYELGNDGILRRNIQGETPVAFIEVELKSFDVIINDNWVNIKISGKNGLNLETTVSMIRIPKKT